MKVVIGIGNGNGVVGLQEQYCWIIGQCVVGQVVGVQFWCFDVFGLDGDGQFDCGVYEVCDEGICGMVMDLVGIVDLFDLVIVYYDNVVGQFECFFLIVGDKDCG